MNLKKNGVVREKRRGRGKSGAIRKHAKKKYRTGPWGKVQTATGKEWAGARQARKRVQ